MIQRVLKFWNNLRNSYWFIPTVMAIGAMGLALLMTRNGWILNLSNHESINWINHSTPEGARSLLSTIAGSMITVAGVSFSITIASVAYATTQFGPRLLTNFMSNRGNQITLGTFIATFLYCLVVLRTIGTGGSPAADTDFVPHLAVTVGVLMGIASVGVLIFFIHHVPMSIHASYVIASVGEQLLGRIESLYPDALPPTSLHSTAGANAEDPLGEDPSEPGKVTLDLDQGQPLRAARNGFIQSIGTAHLEALAKQWDLTIVLNVRAGDFVNAGSAMGWVLRNQTLLQAQQADALAAFLYEDRRTDANDMLFLARELVEFAARALSPGVNDPFTAINCLDWLSSSLALMNTRNVGDGRRYDEEGKLRLVNKPITAEYFMEENLSSLRPYFATDRNAALHFQAVLGRLLLNNHQQRIRTRLLQQSEILIENARGQLCATDISELEDRHAVLALIEPYARPAARLVNRHRWLGGSG